MSRRCHHGSPRHAPLGRAPRRPLTADLPRRAAAPELDAPRPIAEPEKPAPTEAAPEASRPPDASDDVEAMSAMPRVSDPLIAPAVEPQPELDRAPEALPAPARPRPGMRSANVAPMRFAGPAAPHPMRPPGDGEDGQLERTATAPQLRRFIKSRAYVPMHELRRRFGINGDDDEVTSVDLERTRVFVGLPDREGRLLAELLRGGDIGYELSMDPISPIVVGVYPMRPVIRG